MNLIWPSVAAAATIPVPPLGNLAYSFVAYALRILWNTYKLYKQVFSLDCHAHALLELLPKEWLKDNVVLHKYITVLLSTFPKILFIYNQRNRIRSLKHIYVLYWISSTNLLYELITNLLFIVSGTRNQKRVPT